MGRQSAALRGGAAQASTAVEEQVDGAVSPGVELARRQRDTQTNDATLRQSDDHVQKLLGFKASKLDAPLRIRKLAREQIADQRRRLLGPTLLVDGLTRFGTRTDSAVTRRCNAIACGASAARNSSPARRRRISSNVVP